MITNIDQDIAVREAWNIILLYRRFIVDPEGQVTTYFMGTKYIHHPKLIGRAYFASREPRRNNHLPVFAAPAEVEFRYIEMDAAFLETLGYLRFIHCWYNVVTHELRPLH